MDIGAKQEMPITLNFDDVKSEGFEVLPAGSYEATIFEAKQTTAKSSGAPMLALTYKIQDPEHANRRVWQNVSLQPQALWKLKSLLLAAGYTSQELTGGFELDPEDLLGREVVVVVGIREYQGQERNEVTDVKAPGAIPVGAGGGF